jgi:hypothetical protein
MRYLHVYFVLFLFLFSCSNVSGIENTTVGEKQNRSFPQFKTDTSKSSIDLSLVLNGGPGKDGIPALTNPAFESIEKSKINNSEEGVLVVINDEYKFYPYNILVWHEIVNDTVGETPVAVTFCPLCGSAIVFDRNVKGNVLEFGVSGFLYESNMLMYDRGTESFWSQTLGESVIGEFLGTKLDILPMRVLMFEKVKSLYPQAQILGVNTGHARDYSRYPYGSYETNSDIYFPVSESTNEYHPKEMMYVVPVEKKYVAIPIRLAINKSKMKVTNKTIVFTDNDDGAKVEDENGNELPGYYEMWFSWNIHHKSDGVVWDKLKKEN